MSIQGNFNNGIFQAATIASLSKINKSLSEIGISSIDDLNSKIKTLKIEIAKAEDYGISPIKMKNLLEQYLKVKETYEKALEKEDKKHKLNNFIGCTVAIIGAVGILIWTLVVINSGY